MLKALLCFLNSHHLRSCRGLALSNNTTSDLLNQKHVLSRASGHSCVFKSEQHWPKIHNWMPLCFLLPAENFPLHIKKFVANSVNNRELWNNFKQHNKRVHAWNLFLLMANGSSCTEVFKWLYFALWGNLSKIWQLYIRANIMHL